MFDELQKLPQFTITAIRSGPDIGYEGLFDSRIQLGTNWYGYLVDVQLFTCFEGFFSISLPDSASATFIPEKKSGQLHIGQKLAWFDGYWGERAAIVLDKTMEWRRELFKSSDVMQYRSGNSIIRGPVGQQPTFPVEGEGVLVPGGWDHEHCLICWQTISEYEQPYGYKNRNEGWICEECFHHYVESKSFGFLDEKAIAQMCGIT